MEIKFIIYNNNFYHIFPSLMPFTYFTFYPLPYKTVILSSVRKVHAVEV